MTRRVLRDGVPLRRQRQVTLRLLVRADTISEERVAPADVASIVAEAANARNGWRVILARCAPTAKPRSIAQLARELIAARDLGDHM